MHEAGMETRLDDHGDSHQANVTEVKTHRHARPVRPIPELARLGPLDLNSP